MYVENLYPNFQHKSLEFPTITLYKLCLLTETVRHTCMHSMGTFLLMILWETFHRIHYFNELYYYYYYRIELKSQKKETSVIRFVQQPTTTTTTKSTEILRNAAVYEII